MPSTRRHLCEDEKDDVKECMFAEKRVSRSIVCFYIIYSYFLIVSSSTIYVSTSVNIIHIALY